MNALERVREKYGSPQRGTDKTDRSPSVGFVSSPTGTSQLFGRLAADLERRIHLMAKRWRYCDAELLDVLASAVANPVGWQRAVELDERREAEFRVTGVLRRDA